MLIKIDSFFDDIEMKQLSHDIINKYPFTCGDPDLDDYFLNDAVNYEEQLLARTYVFIKKETDTCIAYFSLSNDIISSKSGKVSNATFKKIKKRFSDRKYYSSYPAIKMGRFALCNKLHGNHIGGALLDFIIVFVTQKEKHLGGCRFLTIDAYEHVVKFYEKYKFNQLKSSPENGTLPMYYDLKQFEYSSKD